MKARMSRQEVADHFGVNVATLWRWEQHGCPGASLRKRTSGRPVVYTADDVAKIKEWREGEDERE